jgi:glycopeptide antibiotics resistance protein
MMIYFETPAWIVSGFVLLILLVFLWRKKRNLSYLMCCLVFGVYVVTIIEATLFPIPVGQKPPAGLSLTELFWDRINLIPFFYGPFATTESILFAVVENIILTVPFGFGINFLAHFKIKRILWLGPCVGLAIEAIQLLICLAVNFPYRVVDVNDLWANAVGVWLGYGLFRIAAWLYLYLLKRSNKLPKGFGAYLFDIASNV